MILFLQALSGSLIGSFSTLHLFGHTLSNYKFNIANSFLIEFRKYYQNSYIEAALLITIPIHIALGYYAWYKRSKLERSGKHKKDKPLSVAPGAFLGRSTGMFLSITIFGHILFTRVIPLEVIAENIDLTYITYSSKNVAPVLMQVYLFALGFSGIFHGIYGFNKAFQLIMPRMQYSRKSWRYIAIASGLLMLSTSLALSGMYEEIEIPKIFVYKIITETVKSWFGLN